ncbi:MAG: heme o synthase [Pseudomonadota bacterium]
MTDATNQAHALPAEPRFGDYCALMKPRVMRLVVFTAFAAMAAAPAGMHPVIALASLLCIAVGAGASGALNMWWDADIDAEMARTSRRPVPAGLVEPEEALALGLGLSILSVALLSVVANPLAGGLLAFTIFFYAVIYSMWLKRATPQNIVIGGAAGAFPPMIAWAALTGEIGVEAVLMFAVIFLWTPPHFWALALFRNDDYTRVGVPMLPVVAGEAETRRQIWLYTLALVPAPLLLAFTTAGGPITLVVALAANGAFALWAWRVARRAPGSAEADGFRAEKRLFLVSIAYLFAIFGALIGDAALRLLGALPGWPTLF